MILLILEIMMFIFGLWALISGKLPKFMFGKPVEGSQARVMGAIMLAPLVLALGVGFVIGFLQIDAGFLPAVIEAVLVIGALVIVGSMVRKMPDQTTIPPSTPPM